MPPVRRSLALTNSTVRGGAGNSGGNHNMPPGPTDGFVDITDVSRLTGLFGQHCTP